MGGFTPGPLVPGGTAQYATNPVSRIAAVFRDRRTTKQLASFTRAHSNQAVHSTVQSFMNQKNEEGDSAPN